MNESQLKLLLEAGAIKGMTIVGQGSHLHLEVKTQGGSKCCSRVKAKSASGSPWMPAASGYASSESGRLPCTWISGSLTRKAWSSD